MGIAIMIYICVRATAKWEDERAFLAQLDPAFKPKVFPRTYATSVARGSRKR
jgi:hypothetical protein